jgi:uncharacterized membrane protein
MSVHVRGHPIHVMLVVFPIGLYMFAFIFDVLYLATGSASWFTASFYNLAFGVVMTVPTALFGIFDYTLIRDPSAQRTATKHMLINVAATLLFGGSLALRAVLGGPTAPITGVAYAFAFVLLALGAVALTVGGWLGGDLVYRHRVGVGIEPARGHIPHPVADEAGNRANTFGDFPRAQPA